MAIMMAEWKTIKVGDIGQIITGKTPKTSNSSYYGGIIPFLTPSDDMSVKYVRETKKSITEDGRLSVKNATLPANAVCVSCIGSDLGKVVITTERTVTNQQINSIVINEDNYDIDYIYYAMVELGKILNFHSKTSTAVPIVNKSSFSQYELKCPPLEIQKKIGKLLSSIDSKIEENERINNNLEQQIEAILLSFIENTNSNNVKLGDYLYIKGRIGWKGLKKDEYLEHSDFRIINGESLTKAGIDWLKAGYISQSRYDESPEIMLKKGDILLSKDGTIGKIGYIDSLSAPTTVASGIFVIRNIQPEIISTTFIYFLLKSRLFTDFITARTEGSVIPHLYQKDFMQFEFPLPSKDKMASFEKLTAPMFSLIVSNLNENKRLTRLRDSLLPRLMSGELDVSDIDL